VEGRGKPLKRLGGEVVQTTGLKACVNGNQLGRR
jgi:hypothetical protein